MSYFASIWLVSVGLGGLAACGGATSGPPADGGTQAGSTGIGGAGGTSGAGGSGGQPGPCAAGTTTFHISATNGINTDYCVGLQCSSAWLAVSSTAGRPMPISLPCSTTCEACMPVGCPAICIAPRHMQADGERLTWDGTFWDESTCGPTRLGCFQKSCAAPGKYMVKMCAARSTSDAGPSGFCNADPTPSCVEVEFDYPSTTTVEGVVN